MDSARNTVSFCCIWKGGRVLYTYSVGNHEIENLAALCLEMIPPYHRWYFETIGGNTFGFFMDDGFVFFAIVCESLGNSEVLRFLQKLRDEFRRVGKRGSAASLASLDSLCLQEQLFPVVRHLVASLACVSAGVVWPADNSSPYGGELTPSPCNNANGHTEAAASTKAPLLGKPSKHEKKKMKDHVIAMRDIEAEEHRRSTDRGVRTDSGPLGSNDQGTSASPLHKDYNSSRGKNSLHNKWCRQVRIILAVDAAICLLLLIIWLVICHGIECIR